MTHVIGPPVMVTQEQIKHRRNVITHKYGSEASLRRKEVSGMITPEERIALQELDNLNYLEG